MDKSLEEKVDTYCELVSSLVKAGKANVTVGEHSKNLSAFESKNPEVTEYILKNCKPPHSNDKIGLGYSHAKYMDDLRKRLGFKDDGSNYFPA